MTDMTPSLLPLAEHTHDAATLFRNAAEERCRSCIARISDLNRQTISELSDLERRFSRHPNDARGLLSAYRLADCVHRAFSAAMLLPDGLPVFPPLLDASACNEQLSEYALALLKQGKIDFFSMHLTANKGRGAHAVLLSNYCSTDGGRWLLPLVLAIESHRNALERACEQLLCDTDPNRPNT